MSLSDARLVPISKIRTVRSLVHDYGLSWTARRAWYEARVRAGMHVLRFPRRSWRLDELRHWVGPSVPWSADEFSALWRDSRPAFFFDPRERPEYSQLLERLLTPALRKRLTDSADAVTEGRIEYFSAMGGDLGSPPSWHVNPFTGQTSNRVVHWSRIPMWSEESGDLKYVWEPSRFALAYRLARAYWLTGDERYPESFWEILQSWIRDNPPHHGANWRCGQETALRLMAWVFALYAFADSPSTTPARLTLLAGAIAAQADRIEKDHEYSELQNNNHSMSEGVGLWITGVLFPWFARSSGWREKGRMILEKQARLQIASDGSFSQKSANYHRLMLQAYMYAVRVGELNGARFSTELTDRLRMATEFMWRIHDPVSGGCPNFGGNDGALILPLNECDYRDYRPVCAAARQIFQRRRSGSPGHWTEDILWLAGPGALESDADPGTSSPAQVRIDELSAPLGGYYTLRGNDTWAFFRCGTHRDRPAHADMLHVDLWWKGHNVARDPGTYRYYDEDRWRNTLAGTQVHNTISVDGLDQMERGPRFTWTRWTKASLRERILPAPGRLGYLEGEHLGYTRLPAPIVHRRGILRAGSYFLVIDDLVGEGPHEFKLQWLVDDFPYRTSEEGGVFSLGVQPDQEAYSIKILPVVDPGGTRFDLVRGSESSAPRGWISDYYGVRRPGLSLTATVSGSTPVRLLTVFGPEGYHVGLDDAGQITLDAADLRLNAGLRKVGAGAILRRAELDMDAEVHSLETGQK